MSKEHLIMWKAIEKGWSSSDLKRIKKKIYELWKDFNCSIPFEDAESLCYLLGEPISYKTEWSLIRLCKDGIIDIFEKDGLHYIDLIEFKSNIMIIITMCMYNNENLYNKLYYII